MRWRAYSRRPSYQAVRYPDGRKTVTRRYGTPGNWTRTTTHPNGRRTQTTSTTLSPLAKMFVGAGVVMTPAVAFGAFSIPIYLAAAVLLVWSLRRRTTGQQLTHPRKAQPKLAPANIPQGEGKKLNSDTPTEGSQSWEEAYEGMAEELRQLLGAVEDGESARSFVEQAVGKLTAAELTTPEFYRGEFYHRFQQSVRNELNAEIASYERDIADISSASARKSAELEERLRIARASDDAEAEHSIWKERAQKQAEAQAAGDALIGRASLWTLRINAVDDLGRALGGSRSAPRQPPQFHPTENEGSGQPAGSEAGSEPPPPAPPAPPSKPMPAGREVNRVDDVWRRIVAHEGETFRQIRGQAFSYTVDGKVLRPSTVNQNLSQAIFEQALARVPLRSTVDVQDLRGPSYLYAILMDRRIREKDW